MSHSPVGQVSAQTAECRSDTPAFARVSVNCRLASRLAGWLVVATAVAVLLGGWGMHIEVLRNAFTPVAMAPDTALGLLLAGIALLLDEAGQRRRGRPFNLAAQTCVGAVAVIGLRTLFKQWAGNPVVPGMTTLTAASLIALAAALSLSNLRRAFEAAQHAVVAVATLCLANSVVYLYGATLTLFILANIVAFTFLVRQSGRKLTRAEAARASAEKGIYQLADAMAQIVWTAGPEGNIDYYNRYWYDYTGLTFEETKDWGWRSVIHPDDLEATIQQWTMAFTSLGSYALECRLKRISDGQYRWHLVRATHFRDEQGNVIRWVGTSTDIDDHKRAENKIRLLNEQLERLVSTRTADLEHARSEMQEFVSIASHDMQEPLRKVQAFGDRLRTTARENMSEQARDYLDRMLSASQRMQMLIQDLLRFSRATTQSNQFSPVDLDQVARSILSGRAEEIAALKARVDIGFLPVIDADRLQMRQLLENLIGNGLKFRRSGTAPSIRIYAEEEGNTPKEESRMQIVIEDDGIGFDEKHLDRIFCVFQRLHGRSEYEGTGVGLALCRKIVQRHGGHITARSAPGGGATFLVTLPVRHSRSDGPVESSPAGVVAAIGELS